MRLEFVGGYPKGHGEPFSEETHSGKMLHKVVRELQTLYDFEAGYYDIWRTETEEKCGIILPAELEVLRERLRMGDHLIPLGHHIERAFRRAGLREGYYPHPSRHSTRLREILEADIAVWTFEHGPMLDRTKELTG